MRTASFVKTVAIGAMLLLIGCTPNESPRSTAAGTTIEPSATQETPRIKNLIIYIGDGMGPEAVGLLNAYAKYAETSIYAPDRKTALEQAMAAGTLGLVYHDAADNLVTDSAASATQMASGRRALLEAVGIDRHGDPVETVLDKAQALGKSVGLVSDTRLTHATPACFAAHVPSRGQENDIAVQLIDKKIDVMLSGGLRHFLPATVDKLPPERLAGLRNRFGDTVSMASKRTDERDLLAEAKTAGYRTIYSLDELKQATSAKRLLGLFALSGMPYRIDTVQKPDPAIPTLTEMTETALTVLSRNPEGFFLMVESGIIDWVEHDNDAGSLLHEMIRFDEALRALLNFVSDRSDTLLIVTADHDTGGFGFSYSKQDIPAPVPFPGNRYPDSRYGPSANFGSRTVLDKLYAQKMSYASLFRRLDETTAGMSDVERASALEKLVRENTEFPITQEEAARILETEPNAYRVPGHNDLDRERFPRVDDFEAFYLYGDDVRRALLARVCAGRQNTVWSTGTHTATPIPLIALGPESVTGQFRGLLHTTQWGRTANELLK